MGWRFFCCGSSNDVLDEFDVDNHRQSAPKDAPVAPRGIKASTQPLKPINLTGVEKRLRQSIKFRKGKVTSTYSLGEKIGEGGFATVVEAKEKTTGDIYACKIVKLPHENEAVEEGELTRDQALHEIEIASALNHANVVHLKEFYIGKNKAYLIMEKMDGGAVIEVVAKRKHLNEDEARVIFIQLLNGINYLHRKHIIHRDIKLENLLLKHPDQFHTAKISDFGFSKVVVNTTGTRLGTPQYVAPDVVRKTLDNKYDKSVDMWSAGVALYVMLAGKQPFWMESTFQMLDRILAGDYSYDDPIWNSYSDSVKDLIDKLLENDSIKRLTAEEALEHPWISEAKTN